MPWNAALLGEHRDFRERLSDYAEQEVVTDLHHACELALADVGHALPKRREIGCATSNALRGPDATIVSLPAETTFALPLTGAASICVPSFSASARTFADASSETLEQSTRSLGLPDLLSRPLGRGKRRSDRPTWTRS